MTTSDAPTAQPVLLTPIGEDGKVVNLLPLVGSDSADGAACCADGTCSIG